MPYFVPINEIIELARNARDEAQELFDAAQEKAEAFFESENDRSHWANYAEKWIIGDTRENLAAWNRIVERLENGDFDHRPSVTESHAVINEHARRKSAARGASPDDQLNRLKNASYALEVLFRWY